MAKRYWLFLVGALLALTALAPLAGNFAARAASPAVVAGAPSAQDSNPYSEAWLASNHGLFDNAWTADYEVRLQKAMAPAAPSAAGLLSPLYGPDVRMSNGNVLTSGQNEFQIAINPTNPLNAIGTSNDGGTAGVGIFRTTDGGATWTSRDASFYGVPAACCDPAVAFGVDGAAYVGILDTSPAVAYTIKSTDGGATWGTLTTVAVPDRNNLATDPSNPAIVYITYSDLPATNRIKGYKSTDGGVTWGSSFFVGGAAPAAGYQQSSQPRVASNGWVYVGYQQYLNSNAGCSAGVENVLARSTDGGASFTQTVLSIIQGGACSSAQAGRGIFCVNAGGSSFRSRSHPIIGVSPSNPLHVYMMYSGGDLESAYTCSGATGNHSDTLFRISTDGGVTFTAPAKVNTDGQGKDQYYPWMDVAPSGRIWAGWNDRREDANNFLSRWYQSYSDDEGATWKTIAGAPGNDPVADVQTLPSSFIGDYHGLAATNGNVLGMWYDSRNSVSGDAYTDPQVPPVQGTPTPTVTGTPPTATRTSTAAPTATRTSTPAPTNTPTPAPTVCGQATFSNPAPITINDAGPASPYPSNITVAGASTVATISVSVTGLTHTWPDDIDMLLVGPNGGKVLLMSDAGGSNDVASVNLTFQDGSPAIPDSAQIASGTYGPADYEAGDVFPAPAPAGPYGTSLNTAFVGSNANGTWSLYIVDDAGADVGSIAGGWSLTIGTSGGCLTNTPTAILPTATRTVTIPSGSPTPTVCAPSGGGWTAGPAPTQVPALVRSVGLYFPPDGHFYVIG
ncbi:MAG TPA: sialidase family protein, partial [Chloroflexia bacterium]|nr:sialidase family protein [Chloroflexia bacterium]